MGFVYYFIYLYQTLGIRVYFRVNQRSSLKRGRQKVFPLMKTGECVAFSQRENRTTSITSMKPSSIP